MEFKKAIKTKIINHLEGELKGAELKELSDWIGESDTNAQYYAQVKDIWEASIGNVSELAETEKEWSKFQEMVNLENESNTVYRSLNIRNLLRVAAILVIGIIFGGLSIYFSFGEEPVYITASAPKGSVAQLVLADSTIVYLNAGSQIRYSPETKEKVREVFLEGEAWFDVMKNNSKPFIVHTSSYSVNVTGTQFNVKSYKNDPFVTTTLEEGEVIISSSDRFRLAEDLVLEPGEQAVFDESTREMAIKRVDTNLYTSWRNNKLQFINQNVKEMIVLFERKYGVDIEVNDPDILNYHYTGTIKNETILEMLEIIKLTLPIQYSIEGQKIVISKK